MRSICRHHHHHAIIAFVVVFLHVVENVYSSIYSIIKKNKKKKIIIIKKNSMDEVYRNIGIYIPIYRAWKYCLPMHKQTHRYNRRNKKKLQIERMRWRLIKYVLPNIFAFDYVFICFDEFRFGLAGRQHVPYFMYSIAYYVCLYKNICLTYKKKRNTLFIDRILLAGQINYLSSENEIIPPTRALRPFYCNVCSVSCMCARKHNYFRFCF